MATVERVVDDNEVIKSSAESRHFRVLELSNGMMALVVSDPETDKSAAAVNVDVGSMSDPREVPGVAHFCEHMLFLGTEKYPEENSYMKFISDHGGSRNAFTGLDYTKYFFDIAPEHLVDGVDRLSQFFLHPLFTESATEREVNAVDSENKQNLKSDGWRMIQLDRSLSNQEHDYSKFGTGSRETLLDVNNVSARQHVLEFHKQYYSAGIMCVCVLGRESLDILQDLVVEKFSAVVNKNVPSPEWSQNPYIGSQLAVFIYVCPVKDTRSVSIKWPLDDFHPQYRCNPGGYLSHLLGHEGAGSLLSELKSRTWSNRLHSSCQTRTARRFGFFKVTVDLTEEGQDHVQDIVKLVFQYIHLIRDQGIQERIFREMKKLDEIMFRYKDKEQPSGLVLKAVSCLRQFPMDEVLLAGAVIQDFSPEHINRMLMLLEPERCKIYVTGKHFAARCTQQEKWYKTQYGIEAIPSELLEVWRNAEPHPNFCIPAPNPFIPDGLQLLPEEPLMFTKEPHLLLQNNLSRLWYKRDAEFKLPKTFAGFCFKNPSTASLNPLSRVLSRLLVSCLSDALTEYSYDAALAGLDYSLRSTFDGIFMCVHGYSDKLPLLVQKIVRTLLEFKVEESRFVALKEKFARSLKNMETEQPREHAAYWCSAIVNQVFWTSYDMLDVLPLVTFDRLRLFSQHYLGQQFVEAFIFGNCNPEQAKSLLQGVVDGLASQGCLPLPVANLVKSREIELPRTQHYVYTKYNFHHPNSALECYYQTEVQSVRSNSLLDLIVQLLKEPCFDQLRTKEQLGYSVRCAQRRSYNLQGLVIKVQSTRHAEDLENRVEAFLSDMNQRLANLSSEEFEKNRQALISMLSEKPKKMAHQFSRDWHEIENGRYEFHFIEKKVDYLQKITKSNVVKYFQDFINFGAVHRRKLSIHIISKSTFGDTMRRDSVNDLSRADNLLKPRISSNYPGQEITNITEFKQSMSLGPLPKTAFAEKDTTDSEEHMMTSLR